MKKSRKKAAGEVLLPLRQEQNGGSDAGGRSAGALFAPRQVVGD